MRSLLYLLPLFLLASCQPDPDVDALRPAGPYTPQGWPQPVYTFAENTFSADGFALGKKLFYDPILSRDNTISCGSCHQISAAFAHSGHALSHGVDDRLGTRNSPPLFNLPWQPSVFWDGGVRNLELQPPAPIVNHLEMDETLVNVVAKISADSAYRADFARVFGTAGVDMQRISKAITQFMGTMISDKSRYDKWQRSESGGEMTVQELAGLQVYANNCASCHAGPLFSDFSFRNNGLAVTALQDSGRAHITNDMTDLYKFRVPSLRNLRFTAPYMHDGRFKTLDAVLDHYASGITPSATLDPQLSAGIPLTTEERANLLAFLNTLNDEAFVRDQRFAE